MLIVSERFIEQTIQLSSRVFLGALGIHDGRCRDQDGSFTCRRAICDPNERASRAANRTARCECSEKSTGHRSLTNATASTPFSFHNSGAL